MADFTTPLPQAVPSAATTEAAGFVAWLRSLFSKEAAMARMSQVMALSKSFFNPLEFSRPTSQGDWMLRVSANASRFAPIYMCFFVPIMINSMMATLWLRVGALVLCALWLYAYGYKKEETVLIVFGMPAPKVVVVATFSIIVMLATGMLNALTGAVFLFALVGMPHMSLHVAPSAADAVDAIELQAVCAPGV